jgi:hypothetical protein
MSKETPGIPVTRVVDTKRIIRKNGGPRRRRSRRGCCPPQKKYITWMAAWALAGLSKLTNPAEKTRMKAFSNFPPKKEKKLSN